MHRRLCTRRFAKSEAKIKTTRWKNAVVILLLIITVFHYSRLQMMFNDKAKEIIRSERYAEWAQMDIPLIDEAEKSGVTWKAMNNVMAHPQSLRIIK